MGGGGCFQNKTLAQSKNLLENQDIYEKLRKVAIKQNYRVASGRARPLKFLC
jgi:hypothetical protein